MLGRDVAARRSPARRAVLLLPDRCAYPPKKISRRRVSPAVGRECTGYPASFALAFPIGSGSSPPESDLATPPAPPPAGAVPCPAGFLVRCPHDVGPAASSTAPPV